MSEIPQVAELRGKVERVEASERLLAQVVQDQSSGPQMSQQDIIAWARHESAALAPRPSAHTPQEGER